MSTNLLFESSLHMIGETTKRRFWYVWKYEAYCINICIPKCQREDGDSYASVVCVYKSNAMIAWSFLDILCCVNDIKQPTIYCRVWDFSWFLSLVYFCLIGFHFSMSFLYVRSFFCSLALYVMLCSLHVWIDLRVRQKESWMTFLIRREL